ncbi:putative alpha-1,3-mannosyltransferase MNN14 [Candida viswanathii]|uniref:Putative alpha-1,3-mannosyltransferase MNN14 n=1 Tax=Candida viswanathii TaxID=5486 RepID=A0A367YPR7_9ASCO|nr:putative alpha-1,3-mannosyltransferase MNN14 [Candida viswanathii]
MFYSKRRKIYLLKHWIVICLLLWTTLSLYYIYTYSNFNLAQLKDLIPSEVSDQIAAILDADYPGFDLQQANTTESSVYRKMFKNTDSLAGEMLQIMKNYNLEERCELYFANVDTENGVIVDPAHDFQYNKFDYVAWDEYLRESLRKLKEDPEEDMEGVDDGVLEEQIRVKFEHAKAKIVADEQLLHDYFLHVKIFNKCYVDRDDGFIEKQKALLQGINFNARVPYFKSRFARSEPTGLESKVFPWLTQKSPDYEHLLTGTTTRLIIEPNNFLYDFRSKLSGKGIVLTISDSHLDDCIRLIHLLRFLENTLPIQIIYTELSESSKHLIKQASTAEFHGYMRQNIILVNVTPAIDEQYLYKFDKFGNKILAVLFNSFEEIILLDADTVVTQTPMKFFQLRKYTKSGTLFYHDRNTAEYRPGHDIDMFLKLMNTNMDAQLFGLEKITEKTKSIPLFRHRTSHVMESGLVVLNRARHFSQALIMANMYFFEPITDRIYGDKELFWLALSIMGDESFEFNAHPAAAIGQITPYEERIKGMQSPPGIFISEEVCSNHPAHINDEDNHTLLWFNSGFKFCNQLDKVDFEEEFNRHDRFTRLATLEQFRAFWEGKLVIASAVVPPQNNAGGQDTDPTGNEPRESWRHMEQYCGGYTWCAYSSIGSGQKPDDRGLVIRYTARERLYFEKLGEIWMSSYDYST